MKSLKVDARLFALALSIVLAASVLAGCGDDSANEDVEPEIEEPMSTGPMNAESPPTSEAPGEGIDE